MKHILKAEDLGKPLRLATGQLHTIHVMIPRLRVRIAVDPADPVSWDDYFRLKVVGPTGTQIIERTVKDDLLPGDDCVDLDFGLLRANHVYSLFVDPGKEGEPYALFEDIEGNLLMKGEV